MIIINYYTISSTEEFSIGSQSLFKYVYGHKDRFFPHDHEFYEIFLIVKGTVEHWINGEIQLLPEGSIVLIRPFDIHGFLYTNPNNANNVYINLSFTSEMAKSVFDFLDDTLIYDNIHQPTFPPSVILSKTVKERLISQFSELNIINPSNKREQNLRTKTILADILTRYFLNNLQRVDVNSSLNT